MRTFPFRIFALLVFTVSLLLACDLSAETTDSKPSVILQSPADGNEFHEGDLVAVQSAATDPDVITKIDLLVDGVTARSDSPQPASSGNLFTLSQKWRATPGAHKIGVRAHNKKGIASDVVSVSISVTPSLSQLQPLTPPPASDTPAPQGSKSTSTEGASPTSTNITFKFDDGVTPEQREAVQKGITLAQQYFGDAGPISVHAYSNLDELIADSSQHYNRAADSEQSKNWKQRLQGGQFVAFAEGDAFWAWVSKVKIWQPTYIQYAWQLIAHEYFHIVQNYTSKNTGNDQGPLWLREGSAEYESYVVVANAGLIDLKRLAKGKIERTRGLLNALSAMETLQGAEAEDTETPYSLGFVAAQYMASNYGEPALLKKYWQVRATTATWQEAFQSAFGLSIDEFYKQFEEYRRAELPPYCGTVGEPAASTLTVKFDRQFLPGTLNFQDYVYSQWSPDATGYTFCVKGYPLATSSWDTVSQILQYRKDVAKLDSCGGSCWILYMQPTAPAGLYTFAAELPDGRRAEVQFQHGTVTATRAPPTATLMPVPTISPDLFQFSADVPEDQRKEIRNGVALGKFFLGDAGPFTVVADTDLEVLATASDKANKRDANSPAGKNFREMFSAGKWIACASSGTIWVWVSKDWPKRPVAEKQKTLIHEYFHLVQSWSAKKNLTATGPIWLYEGSADVVAFTSAAKIGSFNLDEVRADEITRSRGMLSPLSSMSTLEATKAEDTEYPYTLGYLATEYLISKYGEDRLSVLRRYFETQGTGATWQDAFKSTFGMSVDEYYPKFEEYRNSQFPSLCGPVGVPLAQATPAPFGIKLSRQLAPGQMPRLNDAWSNPPNIPYVFCAPGTNLPWQPSSVYKPPKGWAGWSVCGGNCVVVYMPPSAPPGTYTMAIELPDGRRAEAQFHHDASSASTASQLEPTQTAPAPAAPAPPPATATPELPPGIYVSAVALDPPEPKDAQYPAFKVTFVNTLGQTVYYKWFVKIYNPDAKQSMGETAKLDVTLTPGTSVQTSAANWKAVGTSPCRQFIARVFYQAPDGTILEFPKPGGDTLWDYFQVCQ